MSQLFETTREPGAPAGYAHVALEQGIDAAATGLTYAIPSALGDLRVGELVIVPLGKSDRPAPGHVIDISAVTDFPKAKFILRRDPRGLSLPPDLVELARWMAAYYCCPLGMVLATMLPAAVRQGVGSTVETWVRASPPLPEMKGIKLTKLQRAVLAAVEAQVDTGEPWIELTILAERAGARTLEPVKQLVKKGLLVAKRQAVVRAATQDPVMAAATGAAPPALVLTEAQQRAVDRLAKTVHAGLSVHLLHGVTGSGKTEVYLRVIEHVMKERRQSAAAHQTSDVKPQTPRPHGAIVLVPEIALTPQTVSRFIGRFDRVAVLHSGLTAAQRHEQWRRIREGQADIVVGARSAVFAPLPGGPAVIVVDEEHEPSYKQDQLPRYHARDVAIKRAQILGIPVMLGSATPSLESYFNATVRGNYHLLQLPARVGTLKLPKVEIVDMLAERRRRYEQTKKGGVHLLSLRLEALLKQVVEQKGQAILLLNRRGYANYIACPDHVCGWLLACDFCDAAMVFHKDENLPTGGVVRCHHCGAEQMLPALCPVCQKRVTPFGIGTQRVEEEIGRKLPGARMLRMDSDAMRTARDYHRSLEQFARGEVDLLVGTQMIAKGLDFPNVRLVGVISADTALNLPDFRAAERTFQLIAQVAGRAGRGDHGGTVVVQTFSPNDPAITLASRHDYETFATREVELRRQVGLPPVTRMARIVVRDKNHLACTERAKTLAQHLAHFNQSITPPLRLRGPAPCPIARIAGFHRMQIEIIAPDAVSLQKLMTMLRNARLLHSDLHTAVDVDPVGLL